MSEGYLQFKCQSCSQVIHTSEIHAGAIAPCPYCGERSKAPKPPSQAPSGNRLQAMADEEVRSSRLGRLSESEEEMIHRGSVEGVMGDLAEAFSLADEEFVEKVEASESSRSKRGLWFTLVVVGLLVIVIAAVLKMRIPASGSPSSEDLVSLEAFANSQPADYVFLRVMLQFVEPTADHPAIPDHRLVRLEALSGNETVLAYLPDDQRRFDDLLELGVNVQARYEHLDGHIAPVPVVKSY